MTECAVESADKPNPASRILTRVSQLHYKLVHPVLQYSVSLVWGQELMMKAPILWILRLSYISVIVTLN